MSWIDEARVQIAKRKAAEEAAAEARRVREAKRRAAYEVEQKDRFTRWLKMKLPHGVELVSVDTPHSARVHVGDGVEFVLQYRYSREPGGSITSGNEGIWIFEAGSESSRLPLVERYTAVSGEGSYHIENALLAALNKYDERRKTR